MTIDKEWLRSSSNAAITRRLHPTAEEMPKMDYRLKSEDELRLEAVLDFAEALMPLIEEQEKKMRHTQHSYKMATHGRSVQVDTRAGTRDAKIVCSECSFTGRIPLKGLMPPEQIDKKFIQRGWELDPHVCPACIMRRAKGKPEEPVEVEVEAPEPVHIDPVENVVTTQEEVTEMPSNITTISIPTPPANQDDKNLAALTEASTKAHKATAMMHRLLTLHFDPDEGSYAEGWTDNKIAEESGMALDYVTNTRKLAYGEMKENAEIAELRFEIKKLEQTIAELNAGAQKEVLALSVRISEVAARYGVK